MQSKNHVPKLNMETSTTGCCPKFDPKPWDGKVLEFDNKTFVKVSTRSFLHIPMNMGGVIGDTWKVIESADADDKDEFIMLSQDISPWKAEHYFWVTKEVPGMNNAKLSGKYKTKVFEGPFKDAKKWYDEMAKIAKEAGAEPTNIFFYYTTCPKCAKVYGKNYVVGLAQIG